MRRTHARMHITNLSYVHQAGTPAGGTLGPFAAAVDCLNWPLTDLLPQCDHDVRKQTKKYKNLCPERGQFEWHFCRPKDVFNMTTYTHLITVARSSNTSTHPKWRWHVYCIYIFICRRVNTASISQLMLVRLKHFLFSEGEELQ